MKLKTKSWLPAVVLGELLISVLAVYALLALLLMSSTAEVASTDGGTSSLPLAADAIPSNSALTASPALPDVAAEGTALGAPIYPAWYPSPYFRAYSNPYAYSYASSYASLYYARNYRYTPYTAYRTPVKPSTSSTVAAKPVTPPSAAPKVAAPAAPSGNTSASSANLVNSWQMLAPGSVVWLKLGSGGDHIDASLEANSLDGVSMQVFAPDSPDRPIGQGSVQNSTGHLVWSGGKWSSIGDWMARIANTSSAAVWYKLTVSGYSIGQCDSISYWEKIGTADVYWTRCK